jgi:hypothetical protein
MTMTTNTTDQKGVTGGAQKYESHNQRRSLRGTGHYDSLSSSTSITSPSFIPASWTVWKSLFCHGQVTRGTTTLPRHSILKG